MKILVVDLYGDGDDLYVFEDKEGIDKALDEFDELDRKQCDDEDFEHEGFSEEMTKRGFPPLEHREISLENS